MAGRPRRAAADITGLNTWVEASNDRLSGHYWAEHPVEASNDRLSGHYRAEHLG